MPCDMHDIYMNHINDSAVLTYLIIWVLKTAMSDDLSLLYFGTSVPLMCTYSVLTFKKHMH